MARNRTPTTAASIHAGASGESIIREKLLDRILRKVNLNAVQGWPICGSESRIPAEKTTRTIAIKPIRPSGPIHAMERVIGSERFTGPSLQRVIIEQSPASPLTPCRDHGPGRERAERRKLRSFRFRACRMTPLYPLLATEEETSNDFCGSQRLGIQLVRSRRLELPRSFLHSDLNAARLPIPPRPHVAVPASDRWERGACLAKARYHIKPDGPRYGHRRGGNRVAAQRTAGAL